MELSLQSKIKLNNAVNIPILGLGTYKSNVGIETQNAVSYALEAGYRLIDTAKIYNNEKDIGIAIKKSSIPRDDIFITTKLWNADHGEVAAYKACESSLKKLQTNYIDLYLIHWPVEKLRLESWKAMEQLLADGKCRAIGVSNFMVHHLKELLENANIIPAVNQVEFHPFLFNKDLLEFCRNNTILLEAYSPLTKSKKINDISLLNIATNYSVTPAQLLIRWGLQHEIVEIPKSTKKERIVENADVFNFTITSEDMRKLDALNENYHSAWDPTNIP